MDACLKVEFFIILNWIFFNQTNGCMLKTNIENFET